MAGENRKYIVIHKNGSYSFVEGKNNLPKQKDVTAIRRMKTGQTIQQLFPQTEKRIISPKTNSENGNIAFFDAEYNTSRGKNDIPQEIISVGIVICDQQYTEITRYYTTVCPKIHPHLEKRAIEITGLTQDEIDDSPGYLPVMQKLLELLEVNQVTQIFVWGSDKVTLEQDLNKNHPGMNKKDKKKIRDLIASITNLSHSISQKYSSFELSLESMKWLCGLDGNVSHNALDDAADLLMVKKIVDADQIPEDRIRILAEYYEKRSRYNNCRRFKKKALDQIKADYHGEFPFITLNQTLEKLAATGVPELEALYDDLKALQYGEEFSYITLESYAKQNRLSES